MRSNLYRNLEGGDSPIGMMTHCAVCTYLKHYYTYVARRVNLLHKFTLKLRVIIQYINYHTLRTTFTVTYLGPARPNNVRIEFVVYP